jgi:hypothetical protein
MLAALQRELPAHSPQREWSRSARAWLARCGQSTPHTSHPIDLGRRGAVIRLPVEHPVKLRRSGSATCACPDRVAFSCPFAIHDRTVTGRTRVASANSATVSQGSAAGPGWMSLSVAELMV